MMTATLVVLVVVLAATTGIFATRWARLKARNRERNVFRPWPLRRVPLDTFDAVFAPGEFGPTLATEVYLVGTDPVGSIGGTSDSEAWVLSTLAKRSRLMFEFGTCTGRTAYMWARNSPPEARVVTITLSPNDRPAYRDDPGDDRQDVAYALAESAFEHFVYTGTPVESKVEQLFGDSKAMDISPWEGRCDLVFVDGSHAYSYVVSDSEKALRLVRPGGIVLWHDYAGPRHSPGVYRALNELARRIPLVHIARTTFAAYRRPVPSS